MDIFLENYLMLSTLKLVLVSHSQEINILANSETTCRAHYIAQVDSFTLGFLMTYKKKAIWPIESHMHTDHHLPATYMGANYSGQSTSCSNFSDTGGK